jgi:hypothetical protein
VKGWITQLAGVALVLIFVVAIGGFVLFLRAQQSSLAATMATAGIRAVTPPDGATDVPLNGEIRADYIRRPASDPAIKLEPPVGISFDNPHWDGATFVIDYHGLRDNSLYHVELDQDDGLAARGEHKQIKVRWSFRTGSARLTTPTPTGSPTPTPTPPTSLAPTPTPLVSTPNLIWYQDQTPGTAGGEIGLDWQGQRVKTIKWVGTTQSPDGHRIYNSMTPSTWVYDADGNRAGSMAGLAPSMWADDSQQFCGIAYQPAAGTRSLVTMPLDGSVHTVAPIVLLDSAGKPVQEVSIAACSDLNRRAIVVGGSNGYVWSMAMISLMDGSVIYQRRYPNPLARLVASHDGQYAAEQLAGNATGGPYTMIRQLPSGNVVGQLTGLTVQGFSWDGSLVAGGIQGNNGLIGAEVIGWQAHQVIWNGCGCPSPIDVRVIAQPGGTKLAIAATNQQLVGSLTIIDTNGMAVSAPVAKGPFSPLF